MERVHLMASLNPIPKCVAASRVDHWKLWLLIRHGTHRWLVVMMMVDAAVGIYDRTL